MTGSATNEERLAGGNAGGAVRIGGTVRRATGPWTPAVHALLAHLEAKGFTGAPWALGVDEAGREVLSYLPGQTVGEVRPWPAWVHSDDALVQVGRWLAAYHAAVADFVPAADAVWRTRTVPWQPGEVIGHNDAAPYNCVWRTGPAATRLVGFVDWDFAAPCSTEWDLAHVAFSWVPLHARHVVAPEGFTAFEDRPRRLRLLLEAYGHRGPVEDFLDVVRARIRSLIEATETAAISDPLFSRLVGQGATADLRTALAELAGVC